MSSSVVAFVTDGVSATGFTVIVAVADPLLKPPPEESVAPWTWKLPLAKEFAAGVNFNPALPSAKVIKLPSAMTVVPSFWKRAPLVMLVILKCVTSVPSAALRLMTSPEVVWVSSSVTASVTDGVLATANAPLAPSMMIAAATNPIRKLPRDKTRAILFFDCSIAPSEGLASNVLGVETLGDTVGLLFARLPDECRVPFFQRRIMGSAPLFLSRAGVPSRERRSAAV